MRIFALNLVGLSILVCLSVFLIGTSHENSYAQTPKSTPTPTPSPCERAKSAGLDNGDGGGTICVDGSKVACVWISGGASDGGQDIHDTCGRKHEETHFPITVDCPPGEGVTRPNTSPGTDPNMNECDAYTAQLECYENSFGDCNGNAACEKDVRDLYDYYEDLRNDYCGRADDVAPTPTPPPTLPTPTPTPSPK